MTIEALGLGKSYGAVRAVDDLSFSLEPGVVTGFLGPNGSGKSTTMRREPRRPVTGDAPELVSHAPVGWMALLVFGGWVLAFVVLETVSFLRRDA